jgi:TolB-like protein/AraC-like DNA-binding protein/tetratricopeptide (TPR) repeat protein
MVSQSVPTSLSKDDLLLERLRKVVLENLGNDQFSVNDLSLQVGLSRSQLYRKLKNITNKSISRFVREIRLNEAANLLENDICTTKEVAYKVGFSSSTYFNKCFHDYYGYAPGELKSKVSLKRSEHQTKKKSIVLSIPITLTQSFWGVLAIILVVLGYFFYANATGNETEIVSETEIADKSIAVLPFKNLSSEEDSQYFSDGMLDAILSDLSNIGELRVISRTSTEQYRDSPKSIPIIANELDVEHILEGSVQRDGDKVRIIVQLIDASLDEHIWSETYDGVFSDTIFVIQSNIAKKIATSLNAVITPEQEKVIEKFPTTNVAAYELYIRGSYEGTNYWRTGDLKHMFASRKLFDQALIIDSMYYDAIFGMGNTFMLERNYDSAFFYVEKLVALDPQSSAPYQLKGECYYFMGKLDLAIESYSTAINISKFVSTRTEFWTYFQLGRTLSAKGDIIKALSYYSKALQLDFGRQIGAYLFIASAFANIGEYDRAARYLQTSMENSIDNCRLISFYASVLLVQGKFPQLAQFINSKCDQQVCEQACKQGMFQISLMQGEFVEAREYAANLQSIESYGLYLSYMDYEIGYVHYQLGRTDESDKIFKEEIQKLESIDHEAGDPNLHLSRIYAFKGDKKRALENLNEFAKRGFTQGWHDFILIDPFFESLRDDPEFKAIVKQAQEEKAALRVQVREMKERGELTF